MRKVVAAGSILVDKINEIGAYPKAGELTQIRARSRVPSSIRGFPCRRSVPSVMTTTGVSPLRN